MKRTVFYAACCVFIFIICCFTAVVDLSFPLSYRNEIKGAATRFDLDELLVRAVIRTESGYDAKAVSKAGAAGLMQLMPSTAEWQAQKIDEEFSYSALFDPKFNINVGCAYLRYLLDKFGNEDHALAAYNAGEGVVSDWISSGRTDPDTFPYRETREYVKRVKLAKTVYSYRR